MGDVEAELVAGSGGRELVEQRRGSTGGLGRGRREAGDLGKGRPAAAQHAVAVRSQWFSVEFGKWRRNWG